MYSTGLSSGAYAGNHSIASRPRWADEFANQPRAMRRQPVPHHQQLAVEVAQQMAKEVDYLGSTDGAGVEPEVKVPPGNSGGCRQHLPIEMILQHRRLSARGPGTHPMRS